MQDVIDSSFFPPTNSRFNFHALVNPQDPISSVANQQGTGCGTPRSLWSSDSPQSTTTCPSRSEAPTTCANWSLAALWKVMWLHRNCESKCIRFSFTSRLPSFGQEFACTHACACSIADVKTEQATQKIIHSLLILLASRQGHHNIQSTKNLRKLGTYKPSIRGRKADKGTHETPTLHMAKASQKLVRRFSIRPNKLLKTTTQMSFTTVMHAFPQNDVPLLFANFANACQLSGTSHESRFLLLTCFEVRQDCPNQKLVTSQVSRLIKSHEPQRSFFFHLQLSTFSASSVSITGASQKATLIEPMSPNLTDNDFVFANWRDWGLDEGLFQ